MVDGSMHYNRHPNELVMFTNHLHKNGKDEENSLLHQSTMNPTYYTQIWMAKHFGIYARERSGVHPDIIYFGSNDMKTNKFYVNNEQTDFKLSRY